MAPKIDATTSTTKIPPNLPPTTVIRLAFIYFCIVFSTAFLFGIIRQLYTIRTYHLPSAKAEIIEAPLMLIAVIVCTNWLVNHYRIPAKSTLRLAVGLLSLGFMACVEFIGSRFVGEKGPMEESEEEEWAAMARALYLFNLMMFGIMPWILMLIGG